MRPHSTDSKEEWYTEIDRTWYFEADEGKPHKDNPLYWDKTKAQFEYEVDDTPSGEGPDESTDAWDATYKENTTRYLRPDKHKLMKINSEVKTVVVDPIPPTYINDTGTEYITLETILTGGNESGSIVDKDGKKIQYSNNTRTIAIKFKDEAGLDCKQIGIYLGELPTAWNENEENIIYYYDRTLEKEIKKNYFKSLSIRSTSTDLYEIKFKLSEKYGEVVQDIGETRIENEVNVYDLLNDKKLSIIIWDIAGNCSIFTFGKEFKTISLEDLNNLVPVNIQFTSIEPENFYIENGIDCKIITNVINPNTSLWEYENVAGLLEHSVGSIDINSYIAGDNRQHEPLDGIREFIITNVTESGTVEVEAWVSTNYDSELDELIKERTYNTAVCGPWVFGEEGRKYHITPYLPKYLHGTEFADFVEYFQLYLNTMYKSLETNRHISGLEKIARIGNFTDINKIESALLQNYSDEFGCEFKFNMESLDKMNNLFNVEGYNENDAKETVDLIKYVFEQLPAYNRYKGTNTGMEMAVKMFGFVCKTVNLWVNRENPIEKDPEFVEENSLDTYKDVFQTSRFDLEFNQERMNYTNFITNVDSFVDLIKSIKPINQILNKIKYIIKSDQKIKFVYNFNEFSIETDPVEYTYTWSFSDSDISSKNNLTLLRDLTKINPRTNQTDLLVLDYISGKVNVLGTFFNSNYNELIIKMESTKEGNEVENKIYRFKRENIDVHLKPGALFIKFKNKDVQTCTEIVKKILGMFNIGNEYIKHNLSIRFDILPGTKYGKSLEPEDNT